MTVLSFLQNEHIPVSRLKSEVVPSAAVICAECAWVVRPSPSTMQPSQVGALLNVTKSFIF